MPEVVYGAMASHDIEVASQPRSCFERRMLEFDRPCDAVVHPPTGLCAVLGAHYAQDCLQEAAERSGFIDSPPCILYLNVELST